MANQISQSTIDSLSAGAVPELPVVAWSCTQSIPDDGKRLNCVSSNAAYVAMHSAYNWQDLTPKAPAQAIIHARAAEIERLKRENASALTAYTVQKRERERVEGELRNCESRIHEQRAEINRLDTALKAKQVAEADEVMRLADAMGRHYADWVTSGLGRTLILHNAAREALRAALTKDRT